jgi:hypothetical protein
MPASARYAFGALMADGAVLMLTEVDVDPYVLVARRVESDGSTGDPVTVTSLVSEVSGSPFTQTSVVAATGDGAFVAWRERIPNPKSTEFQRLLVRRYRAQGGFQMPALMRAQPTGSIYPNFDLAAMPGNGAVIAWVESLPEDPDRNPMGPTSLYVATYSDVDGWSAATRLAGYSPEQPIGINNVTVGTSASGHIVVMWSQSSVDSGETLMAAQRDTSGSWGSPALVYKADDDLGADCFALGVAVDGLGNAMAVWEYKSWDASVHRSGFNRLQAGSGWLGEGTLSEFAVDPKVVVNSAGDGLIAWSDDGYVLAVNFGLSGFGASTVISIDNAVPAGAAVQPQATIGEDGYGAVVWNQFIYTNGDHLAVRGARYTPTATWSGISTISSMTEVGMLSHLTNTRDGLAAAIWNQGRISQGQSTFWFMPFALKAA